jgi:hypothetical protein
MSGVLLLLLLQMQMQSIGLPPNRPPPQRTTKYEISTPDWRSVVYGSQDSGPSGTGCWVLDVGQHRRSSFIRHPPRRAFSASARNQQTHESHDLSATAAHYPPHPTPFTHTHTHTLPLVLTSRPTKNTTAGHARKTQGASNTE